MVQNKTTESNVWGNFGFAKYPEKDLDRNYRKRFRCTVYRVQFKINRNTTDPADHLTTQLLNDSMSKQKVPATITP